jgi:uncharacterized protein (UPF0261 family)
MFNGYCGGIGPERLITPPGIKTPRLVIPGGLDCAVLSFTRETVPEIHRKRKIFYYDFRSGIRLTEEESRTLAETVAGKLNQSVNPQRVLIPLGGWSEADRAGEVLFDPPAAQAFLTTLKKRLKGEIPVVKVNYHINDPAFAGIAVSMMREMIFPFVALPEMGKLES